LTTLLQAMQGGNDDENDVEIMRVPFPAMIDDLRD
jgi:hypothetical protein